MIEKFGKESISVISLKNNFIENNDSLVSYERKIIEFYKKQEIRKLCKNCEEKLNHKTPLFFRQGIKYIQCSECSHLNGEFQDTMEFNNFLYTSNEYAENYVNFESYFQRLKKIYLPKADFLLNSLESIGYSTKNLKCLDFGCGSGYFVEALSSKNINTIGYDVSNNQIEFGNRVWKRANLFFKTMPEMKSLLENVDVDIISMIGVLEHLENPNEFLHAINNNTNIKYLYISVPLFSLSVYFQLIFENIFERQLASGHTHLYTNDSLKYLQNRYNLEIVSEWYFGTDIVDLYRSSIVTLSKNNSKSIDSFDKMFKDFIDKFQLEIDKSKQSSEVHMLLKKEIN